MSRNHWTEPEFWDHDWLRYLAGELGLLAVGTACWWPVMAWGLNAFQSGWGCFPVIGMIIWVFAQLLYLSELYW